MKKVIYTVLTGNYDKLEQPRAVDSSYDYVCFTDKTGRDGVWQIREIPFASDSPILRARWAKLHPHALLPEYDLSVFMDANLCIASPIFYDQVAACKAPLALLEHPQRDCVYEELRYCYLKDKISTTVAFSQWKKLKGMGMPEHAGLYETNVVLRRHNLPEVVALDELWWEMLLDSGGTRDQLALTPALYQLGMEPVLLLGPGLNARNVPYIRYTNHPSAPERTPGKLNWANLKYNLRLGWRKTMLLCLR